MIFLFNFQIVIVSLMCGYSQEDWTTLCKQQEIARGAKEVRLSFILIMRRKIEMCMHEKVHVHVFGHGKGTCICF